ncbi:MAG: c-type cytochrome [Alphaproteobacteria bacterium]|nr:c-type cytochrome [Alphaproteobacteria bacterium]
MSADPRILILLVAIAIHAGAAQAQSGDAEAGRAVFGECEGCHEIGAGARHGIGPHLNGVFGRPAASHETFAYSPAFLGLRDRGLVWDETSLEQLLEDPEALAPGSPMGFDGLPDIVDRRNLIAFLRGIGDGSRIAGTGGDRDHGVDPAVLAIQGDAEYGAWLSGECVTCHRADGGDAGIPSIVRWPPDRFVIAMHAYRTGRREHPVMQMIARRLGDEEIAALAAYFENSGE